MEESKPLKIIVTYGHLPAVDNRLLEVRDNKTLDLIATGSRTDLVKAFNKLLKERLEPHAVEKLQTHTLPNYVKNYFGGTVTMERHSLGFAFKGPKFYVVIQKDHAEAARRGIAEYVKKRRKKQ